MSTTEDKLRELELTVIQLEGDFKNLRENTEKKDESLTEQFKKLGEKIDDLPCDEVRTTGLPALSNAIAKLQVYQVVTWFLLMLVISGMVGLGFKVISAGGIP